MIKVSSSQILTQSLFWAYLVLKKCTLVGIDTHDTKLTNYLNIFVSFHHNIMCKNGLFDMGLNANKIYDKKRVFVLRRKRGKHEFIVFLKYKEDMVR